MKDIIKAKILVSGNFASRSIFGDFSIASKVILDYKEKNINKEFLLYLYPEKQIIEITNNQAIEKKRLTDEERAAIIEQILYEYCSLYGSICSGTVRFDILKFYLVDTTNKDICTADEIKRKIEKPILIEYLESKQVNYSTNPIFISLKKLYSALNKGKFKESNCQIEIDSKLKFLNKKDFKYYANCLLEIKGLYDLYDINVNKEGTMINISKKN